MHPDTESAGKLGFNTFSPFDTASVFDKAELFVRFLKKAFRVSGYFRFTLQTAKALPIYSIPMMNHYL
jgi:hypothetical protein